MNLIYQAIYTRCQNISDYEAGRIVDAAGNSMFAVVAINAQDEDLIREYFKVACVNLSKELRWVEDYTETTEGASFSVSAQAVVKGDVEPNMEAAAVAYIMTMWLADKSAERSAAWRGVYDEMMRNLAKGAQKKKPTL